MGTRSVFSLGAGRGEACGPSSTRLVSFRFLLVWNLKEGCFFFHFSPWKLSGFLWPSLVHDFLMMLSLNTPGL